MGNVGLYPEKLVLGQFENTDENIWDLFPPNKSDLPFVEALFISDIIGDGCQLVEYGYGKLRNHNVSHIPLAESMKDMALKAGYVFCNLLITTYMIKQL